MSHPTTFVFNLNDSVIFLLFDCTTVRCVCLICICFVLLLLLLHSIFACLVHCYNIFDWWKMELIVQFCFVPIFFLAIHPKSSSNCIRVDCKDQKCHILIFFTPLHSSATTYFSSYYYINNLDVPCAESTVFKGKRRKKKRGWMSILSLYTLYFFFLNLFLLSPSHCLEAALHYCKVHIPFPLATLRRRTDQQQHQQQFSDDVLFSLFLLSSPSFPTLGLIIVVWIYI